MDKSRLLVEAQTERRLSNRLALQTPGRVVPNGLDRLFVDPGCKRLPFKYCTLILNFNSNNINFIYPSDCISRFHFFIKLIILLV